MFLKRKQVREYQQKRYRIMWLSWRRICAEKRKGISIVKGGERRSVQVYQRTIEEEVY